MSKKQYEIRGKQTGKDIAEKIRKAMDETEDFHVKKVGAGFARQLLDYRISKGWKRKDLALFLNLKEGVIADLETGKAVYDPQLVHKIKMRCKLV